MLFPEFNTCMFVLEYQSCDSTSCALIKFMVLQFFVIIIPPYFRFNPSGAKQIWEQARSMRTYVKVASEGFISSLKKKKGLHLSLKSLSLLSSPLIIIIMPTSSGSFPKGGDWSGGWPFLFADVLY